ncbi:MAG: nucleotidyl transferase AbiEii/AbiGii toxin family protein [Bacteroidales bacterium]|nr:nucleotidyl transferase AbiEii/AbiGii toxin family protein [Bacteroidales bacterium]
MSASSMSLKAKINNYAKQHRIAPQVVLQNYLFERFLERVSLSEYRDNLIIKGGLLISSLVGLDTRSTMDLDTTLQHIRLTPENAGNIVRQICDIDTGDGITFEVKTVEEERKNDRYGGFCIKMSAIYGSITASLSIDMTTGDIITPTPIEYQYAKIFDSDTSISLWAYNVETILAEKIETILSRNILNTRVRDYYDVYILSTTKNIRKAVLYDALRATSEHRGSWDNIQDIDKIMGKIESDSELRDLWMRYQRKFLYAKDITFELVIAALKKLLAQ